MTLASIVEKETAKPEERPLVAAVYANRLQDRHGAAVRSDRHLRAAARRPLHGNLRRDDLQFDSPYNTYRYAGLAAGPIAAPGNGVARGSRRARRRRLPVLRQPQRRLARVRPTLDEHNRNVQRWQVQSFRDQRAGRTGSGQRKSVIYNLQL